MGDPRKKSRKRSGGKRARPLKNFTLYLDENFDCEEVKAALSSANIKFRTHREFFRPGEEDPSILALAGKHGWVVLTTDSKNRYRELERKSIMRYKVRQFIFTANLGAFALAELIVGAYQKMRRFARDNERPFVAVVTKAGDIYLRMNSDGKSD